MNASIEIIHKLQKHFFRSLDTIAHNTGCSADIAASLNLILKSVGQDICKITACL